MVDVATLPQRLIVTGASGTGKTSFCLRVIEAANAAGWQVTGLLSLPRFEAGRKTGIVVLDLSNGEQRLLASNHPNELAGLAFGQWTFDIHTLKWGNDALKHLPPYDVVVVDELGPLEFDRQQGWTAGFDVLARHTAGIAIATVRPSLLTRLQAFWPDSVTIYVGDSIIHTY
jgi:nucleoside-triphosphatase THEP1